MIKFFRTRKVDKLPVLKGRVGDKSFIFFSTFITLGLGQGLTLPQAFGGDPSLQIEPIVGYERVQELLPTPHFVNRFIYGASLAAGYPAASLEAIYTHGETQEAYPPNVDQVSSGDRLRVGLRSGTSFLKILTVYLRGGMQASQDQTKRTANGVTTTTFHPMEYHPYAGTGAKLQLSPKIHASIDLIVTVKDINQMDMNEYQVSAGFGIRLP